jgi:hypothetical protein
LIDELATITVDPGVAAHQDIRHEGCIEGSPFVLKEGENSVFLNSTHPEDRKIVEEAVERAIVEHARLSVDCRIVRPEEGAAFLFTLRADG